MSYANINFCINAIFLKGETVNNAALMHILFDFIRQ